MDRRARRAGWLLVVCSALTACSSSVALRASPVAKVGSVPAHTPPVRVSEVGGDPCFRQEVLEYLEAPGGLQLETSRGTRGLTLRGALDRLEVHSNRGDKEVLMLYYSAFVITAPLAAAVYAGKDWQADAAAEGWLEASDEAGRVVWTKSLTVSVAEAQRTLPTHRALKAAMSAAACQKIAATLLNALADALSRSPLHPDERLRGGASERRGQLPRRWALGVRAARLWSRGRHSPGTS